MKYPKSETNNNGEPIFGLTEKDIEGFVKTRQDFIEGKTTARCWDNIKDELDQYDDQP